MRSSQKHRRCGPASHWHKVPRALLPLRFRRRRCGPTTVDALQRFSGFDQIRSSASIWATEAICFNMKSLMSPGRIALPCRRLMLWVLDPSRSEFACCGNFSPGATLRRAMGRCGLSRPGGLFYFRLCSRRLLVIFVHQGLKLCRKFRIGCADHQVLEEKRPFVRCLLRYCLSDLSSFWSTARPRSCMLSLDQSRLRAQSRADASGKTCQLLMPHRARPTLRCTKALELCCLRR